MARYRGLLVYFVGVILSAVYILADLRRRRAITRFNRVPLQLNIIDLADPPAALLYRECEETDLARVSKR